MAKARKIDNIFGNPSITLTTSKNSRVIITEKEVAPDAIWIIYKQWRDAFEIGGWAVTKEEAVERLKILGGKDDVHECYDIDMLVGGCHWKAQRISKDDSLRLEM